MPESLPNLTNQLSVWVDAHLATKDPEARLWHRVAKIGEEHGEVIQALIGVTNGNPRKPDSHTMADVQHELLDVALCALAAWSHTTGNQGDSLAALHHHAIALVARAGLYAPSPHNCTHVPGCYLDVCAANGCQLRSGQQKPGPGLVAVDEARETGLCIWCLGSGFRCHPTASNRPEVKCPGEICATCDDVAGDQEGAQ